ncbi:MAG TPA: pyridoxamine 5'-phosphate oxidase family protein [Actinocrinis sp.]|nr:pyridoxamine 5'-phosphate oxidase family protein [Actinocrinis sp.]
MELSRRECLMLLSTRSFGRIVYTASGLPAVVPVNFLVEPAQRDEDVLVCTVRADWLLAPINHAVVGLQADELDRGMDAGWWVTVVGRAEHVEDRGEAAALRADPRWPRTIDESEAVVRLRAGLTSGRRLSATEPAS